MFKNILIPTDGSSASLEAARAGIAFAKECGASVVVTCVLQPIAETALYYGMSAMVAGAEDTFEQSIRTQAEHAIAQIKEMALAGAVSATGEPVIDSFIPEGIVKAAKDHGCDLIFIGSHGRSGFRKLLLGSVTNKVIMLSHMPVLVYRLVD